VRNLRAIVGVTVANANGPGHNPPMYGRITFDFVGHKPTCATTQPSRELTKASCRGLGIIPILNEFVDDIAVLVYSAIETALFPTNANEHFVQMPGIPLPTMPPAQSSCTSRADSIHRRWTGSNETLTPLSARRSSTLPSIPLRKRGRPQHFVANQSGIQGRVRHLKPHDLRNRGSLLKPRRDARERPDLMAEREGFEPAVFPFFQ
jgi:hypothetical protein